MANHKSGEAISPPAQQGGLVAAPRVYPYIKSVIPIPGRSFQQQPPTGNNTIPRVDRLYFYCSFQGPPFLIYNNGELLYSSRNIISSIIYLYFLI